MPKKKPKDKKLVEPTFRIFCEGEKTEPYYINGYVSHNYSDKKNIILVEDTNKNTPVQLVEAAVKSKAEGIKCDVYWVVFDREAVTKYPHKLHAKAKALAKRHNIEIAFSNVCFEFWLLLHFQYTAACYESCDDLLRKSNLKSFLKGSGIQDYDKGYAFLFDALKGNVEDAIRHSTLVKKNALETAGYGKTSPWHLNPYTDVHELIIDIGNFINKNDSCRK